MIARLDMNSIAFQPFAPRHIEEAAALSRAESWPHRPEDWAFVLELGHGIAASVENCLVGTAFAVPFVSAAALNMIIVAPRMRGHGLGRALVERAMAAVPSPEWLLTATEDGLPLYCKLGFVATGEIVQYQGAVASVPPAEAIAWADASDVPTLVGLDQAATGMDRTSLIAVLLREGRVAVLREGDRAVAFGAIRPFGRGEVVGPVVASDLIAAEQLLAFLVSQRETAFIRVDVHRGGGLEPTLEAMGLVHVGGGIAMSRDAARRAATDLRTFALASQALG